MVICMKKEEYIKTVADQIRYQKARGLVEKELSDHIEDQAESYRKEGMDEEEALDRAVREMGDPVEAGVEFDRVHRPKMEWRLILWIAFLSVLGLVIQYLLALRTGSEQAISHFPVQCVSVAAGFLCMMAVCYVDYSRIGKYAKPLMLVLLFLLFGTSVFGMEINGARRYWKMFFGIPVDILPCMLFSVPLFGGVVYSCKGMGRKGFLKSILWMLLPVAGSLRLSSLYTSMVLYGVMLLMVTAGTLKGWFGDRGKRLTAAAWAVSVLLPAFWIAALLASGTHYRTARLKAWLAVGSDRNGAGYIIGMIRDFLGSARWVGAGRGDGDVLLLPNADSDFLMTYLIAYYGILAAFVLVSLLALLLAWCLKVSVRQKNQLGMMMGFGCSLVFLVQAVLHVLVNLSLLPNSSVYLPLFSSGGTATVVSFLLLGVILSVYRYQNVLPAEPLTSSVHIKFIRNS